MFLQYKIDYMYVYILTSFIDVIDSLEIIDIL